jgi:hypothetical protein
LGGISYQGEGMAALYCSCPGSQKFPRISFSPQMKGIPLF